MRIFLMFLVSGIISLLYAQPEPDVLSMFHTDNMDSVIVEDVIVSGNEKTKDIVILREMVTQPGDFYNAEQIETDRKRIQNLQLFTRVEIIPVVSESGLVLEVNVAEQWYLLPYPILFRNEGTWDKISYGVGLIHQNFRGMNNLVNFNFWFGYNPGLDLTYSNPWIGGSRHYYYKMHLYTATVRSLSLEYQRFDMKYSGGSFTLGRKWGHHLYLAAITSFNKIKFPLLYQPVSLSGSDIDYLPSAGMQFRYDTRDLYEYPRKGWFFDVSAMLTHYGSNIHFSQYGVDLRKYMPVYKKLVLAVSATTNLTSGQLPIYSRNYLGYSKRIRGEFNTVQEGENRLTGSMELRFPVLIIRYLNLDLSGLGGYDQNLPFGISGGLFCDAGAVWYQKQHLTANKFLKGFGAGLHFHLPYVQVMRFEYALNMNFERQYIIDTGVAF